MAAPLASNGACCSCSVEAAQPLGGELWLTLRGAIILEGARERSSTRAANAARACTFPPSLLQNGGLDTEADWPYTAADPPAGCDAQHAKRRVVSVDGFQEVPPSEVCLLQAVAHQVG